jgi:hypothetical protein
MTERAGRAAGHRGVRVPQRFGGIGQPGLACEAVLHRREKT